MWNQISKFQHETHACAYTQSACYFARQHSFRVSCASAPAYEFSHEFNVFARRGTLFIFRTKTPALSAGSTHCMCTPSRIPVQRSCTACMCFSMCTRKRALSFERHNNNIRVVDTCLAFVPATVSGRRSTSDAVRRTKT